MKTKAEKITKEARKVLKEIHNYLDLNSNIIYGDTDSVFVEDKK